MRLRLRLCWPMNMSSSLSERKLEGSQNKGSMLLSSIFLFLFFWRNLGEDEEMVGRFENWDEEKK